MVATGHDAGLAAAGLAPGTPGVEPARTGATPDIVSSPLVRAFFAFWQARCRDGRLPAKGDMDPVEMRAFLPYLILTEVLHDPSDFQYRIIGDEVVARFGNLTGRRVRGAALINLTSSAYENYRSVAIGGRSQFLEGPAVIALIPGRVFQMSRVHCPLAADGATVDHIISCVTVL